MDITKCEGYNCPLREKCYNFKAPENEYRQSYFSEHPFDFENNTCKYFWEDLTIKKQT